jgi:hypothetical protein
MCDAVSVWRLIAVAVSVRAAVERWWNLFGVSRPFPLIAWP